MANLNEKFSIGGNLAINFVMNKNYYWNERSLSAAVAYHLTEKIDFTGGIFSSFVNQSEILQSREIRPVFGFRFFRPNTNRFVISNFTRFEFRSLFYSDGKNDFTVRVRNMTHLFFSLTQQQMNLKNNLFLFSYFELFYNFDDDVRERFFNFFKVKLGAGYRFTIPLGVDLGVIYQETEEKAGVPTNLPVNYETNFIFEWRVIYFIGSKKEKN